MNGPSLLVAVFRRWWIVLLLTVLGTGVGAIPEEEVVEEDVTRTFDATHTMLLNDQAAVDGGATGVSPSQVALFATTGEVPRRVAEQIGFDGTPASLAGEITVEFDFNTGALTFSTTQDSAERAELIANTFAEVTNAYLVERQDVTYQERLAASLDRVATLEEELDQLSAQLAADPEDETLRAQRDAVSRQYGVAFEQSQSLTTTPVFLQFTTLEQAQAIEQTSGGVSAPTTRTSRALMGGVVGFALGVAIAALLGRLDRRIRTREQAEEIMGMRARATVPKSRDNRRDKLVVVSGRHDALSDSFRMVRNLVGFVRQDIDVGDRAHTTVVVSPGPGDGKTTLATNLAGAFVENGQRTIAVNTDFRRPRLAKSVDDTPTDHPFVLDDLEVLSPKSLLTRTETSGLLVMDLSSIQGPAGELVRATTGLLPEVARMCDELVIDTSPVGATAEVLDVLPYADVIVVAVRVGHTNIAAARRTIATLRDVSTAPIVLVVTGVKQDRSTYYEYGDRRRHDEGAERSRWRRRRNGAKTGDQLEPVG